MKKILDWLKKKRFEKHITRFRLPPCIESSLHLAKGTEAFFNKLCKFIMDVDCTNMLDLYLANETTNTLFDSVWPEGYVFSANNNKMTDDNDKRDIQDLFNGETNLNGELDDGNRCLESWEGGASTPDVKELRTKKSQTFRFKS